MNRNRFPPIRLDGSCYSGICPGFLSLRHPPLGGGNTESGLLNLGVGTNQLGMRVLFNPAVNSVSILGDEKMGAQIFRVDGYATTCGK